MQETYNDLTVCFLSEETMKHCNSQYPIIVQNNWGAHTAFYTIEKFNEWMETYHLKLGEKTHPENNWHKIIGGYSRVYFFSIEPTLPDFRNFNENKNWDAKVFREFGEKNNLPEIKIMDNGDYTTGFVYHGPDYQNYPNKESVTIVYLLNPNCKRDIYKQY